MEVQRNTASRWYLLWFVRQGEELVILGSSPTQISASMPENKIISNVMIKHVFGSPTRTDTNRAVQPNKMAGGLKCRIQEVEGLYMRVLMGYL